jgi:membrane associated rhomboid family serine protease
MNGEPKMAPMGTNTGKALCLMCCPCFVDPCGRERRKEYKKSLRSFTLPMCFIQIAMLIVALALGGVVPLSQNPAVGPGANTFILLGAKDTLLIQQGQVFRFITPVFLHAGIFHLLVNVLAEWRFGLYVERKWGTLRYVVIYFLAAIGATIMSCLLNPTAISVGASGALMGLLGAYLADILMSWSRMEKLARMMALFQTLFWIAITMLFGFSTFVDTAAHFGGVVTGFMVGCALFSGNLLNRRAQRALLGLFIALTIAWFAVGITLIYTVITVS